MDKRLKKIIAEDHPELLHLVEQKEANDLLKGLSSEGKKRKVEISVNGAGNTIQGRPGEKGEKGDKGDTPVKYVDYFLPEEIDYFLKKATPIKDKDYSDGQDGKDGRNGTDGIDGKDGKNGLNGKDTFPENAQSLADKLNTLEGVIEQKVIKGLPTIEGFLKELKDPRGKNKLSSEHILNMPARGKLDQRWHGGGGGSGSTWTPQGVTNETVGGIVAGTDLGTSPVTIENTLTAIFYPLSLPSVVLTPSVAGGIREIGDVASLSAVTFSATTTQGVNPITLVDFYRGVSLIYSVPSPISTGAVENDPNPETITTTASFTSKVGDGILPNVTSNTVSYTFISAIYYGSDVQGLDVSSDGGGLSKSITGNFSTISFIYNCTFPEVYYFCYPQAYGALTEIKDTNGFPTTEDWTASVVSITNSFGSTVSYYKYEFNNPNTTSNFTNTFLK